MATNCLLCQRPGVLLRISISTVLFSLCLFAWTFEKKADTFLLSTKRLKWTAWVWIFFIWIFLFRYVRLVINTISFLSFKSVTTPQNLKARLTSKDCTIIVPTVDPQGPDFPETIRAALANEPLEVLVVTVGEANAIAGRDICNQYHGNVRILHVESSNKRKQIMAGVRDTNTEVVITIDDHVFLGPHFIREILPPFEDPCVGGVGTNKRVRRVNSGWCMADFVNFLAVIYLERRNFDMAATTNIDGGLSCLSGRAACYRTIILADPDFEEAFVNEYQWIPFKGVIGPLNAGDDKMITRWLTKKNWDIKIQYSDAGMIETTLGDPSKWLSQCLRWARTTWRDNPNALFLERTVWRRHPWCVYAVYFSSFVNFALFYDAMMLVVLWFALDEEDEDSRWTDTHMILLGLWILASKLVKPMPHFWRQPRDLVYLPGLIVFGYVHSFIKLWALFTCWNIEWSGRMNVKSEAEWST